MMQRVKPLSRILAEGSDEKRGLKRSLGPWALTAMGIGAIIGTGIFVLTGVGSATRAGPALTISFVIAGIVSGLAALCYAEVSSKVPISGSAYTYTYATLGEFFAWIVGWALVLEYALGASTVSVGWSGYFTYILHTLHIWDIPQAWQHSHWDPTPGIANLPAAAIILAVTALLVKGTRESGNVNAIIVAVKVTIVLFFIAIGVGHIDPANYHLPAGPATGAGGFFPFGWGGVLGGAAFMFFAYIGFDAVSTTAEEAKNPGKDLPFGILMSLAVCTVLYIIVVIILNGMVPFNHLNVAYPVAFAVDSVGLAWAGIVISFGAIAGLTTVLLVMMFGQTRIFYAMSRDGLIPPLFVRLHPVWRTPWVSQIIFGLLIAAAGALFPIGVLGSLTNMGTFVAFVLVACSVPLLRNRHPELKGSFKIPFGPYVIPTLAALSALGMMYYLKFGNPVVWGFPIAWLGFLIWLTVGLLFYFAYGRHKSTVALEQVEHLAIRQPPVN
ncbi:MAG: amino acid permease [Candidatus Eremiobacteraeota bacterium]|nr:amino acid permease [Candidatus Eremiobacteraeota bacterium]